MTEPVSYRRAMVVVTASSLLVPVIGLATAPILTHSLGVMGRGESGAAIAPNLVIVGGATLGLQQAVTYHVAKRPHLTRRAIGWSTAFTLVLGLVTGVVAVMVAPYLSAGDPALAQLMVLGTWLALPALVVAVLRGAASGRQMWTAVAMERILNSVIRLVALAVLALVGALDVRNAVLVMALGPVIAGAAYLKVLLEPPAVPSEPAPAGSPTLATELLAFGSRVWLGSVATMLMARLSQLLVTPLSDVEQLGLLIVAITVSDVPYIVTQTIREVSFGASSAESDLDRLLSTSRVATLAAFVGSAVLGASLPLWIGFVFGQGFEAAILPAWLLLGASVAAVPGLIAGAGLDSAGRPGLRSLALAGALVVNLAGLVVLVPHLGAVGAALAGFVSTMGSTVFVLVAGARILRCRGHEFYLPRRTDVGLLVSATRGVVGRMSPKVKA